MEGKLPTIIGKDGKPVKFISKIILNDGTLVDTSDMTRPITSLANGEVAPEDINRLESTLEYKNGEAKAT